MADEPGNRPAAARCGPISHAIVRLAKAHRARARHLLRDVGLHPGQELILMMLWDCGPQRQRELATRFDTDSASMTRSVQRLERAGYVRRVADPADGRATLVEPTAASLVLRERIELLWSRLEADTVGGMSAAEQRTTLRALQCLEDNLPGT
jgi:MarR family transcriptional regulator, organic hydroperoxide resistance regulator